MRFHYCRQRGLWNEDFESPFGIAAGLISIKYDGQPVCGQQEVLEIFMARTRSTHNPGVSAVLVHLYRTLATQVIDAVLRDNIQVIDIVSEEITKLVFKERI